MENTKKLLEKMINEMDESQIRKLLKLAEGIVGFRESRKKQ